MVDDDLLEYYGNYYVSLGIGHHTGMTFYQFLWGELRREPISSRQY